MKTLCEQLVFALGWCGIEAAVPDASVGDYDGWEVKVSVPTNRYANPQGERRLELTMYFTPNGKWLFAIATDAYEFEPENVAVRCAVQEAVAVPNNSPAWMTEYELDAGRCTIALTVRTCVAGEGTLRNVLAPLLDDIVSSADYYHDLMQVAAQQGQCLAELVQDSLYVASLVEVDSGAEEVEEEGYEEEEVEDEDDSEDKDERAVEQPQAKLKRQLPWE